MNKSVEQQEGITLSTFERENWAMFRLPAVDELIRDSHPPAIGYLIWTRPNHGEEGVQENIEALRERDIHHIRTGISWAEWFHPENRPWIRWYIREYAKHFTVLPCLAFTPHEIGMKPSTKSPPKDIKLYGRFVREVIVELGDCFSEVELWNEWNLDTDWDMELDPDYRIFTAMIMDGAKVARRAGKRVVFGGLSRENDTTIMGLERFAQRGMPEVVDVPSIHNLRGTWSDDHPSSSLRRQASLIRRAWGRDVPVWLTEYGLPVALLGLEGRGITTDWLEDVQVALFAYAVYSCLAGWFERVYWYTYKDEEHESLRAATTGWEDKLQWYFGDTDQYGKPRRLAKLLLAGGPIHVLRYAVEHHLMSLVDQASLGRQLQRAA